MDIPHPQQNVPEKMKYKNWNLHLHMRLITLFLPYIFHIFSLKCAFYHVCVHKLKKLTFSSSGICFCPCKTAYSFKIRVRIAITQTSPCWRRNKLKEPKKDFLKAQMDKTYFDKCAWSWNTPRLNEKMLTWTKHSEGLYSIKKWRWFWENRDLCQSPNQPINPIQSAYLWQWNWIKNR